MPLSAQQQSIVLDLARGFVREALGGCAGDLPDPADTSLHQPAGCFVSLHSLPDRRLRGCVGRIDAGQPLIETLRTAACSVLRDPRFVENPVRLDELTLLEIEISVLSAPRPAPHVLGFEPLDDGIYLTFGAHGGFFLPQVARETGWTRQQLLERLCTEKMGLPETTWKHPDARLHVFSVQVIGPALFQTVAPSRIGKQVGAE